MAKRLKRSAWTVHAKGILTETPWPFSEMMWVSGEFSLNKVEKEKVGEFIVQKRECGVCGKQELHTTSTRFRS